MNQSTVTRLKLATAVHENVGLPRDECADLVESILQTLIETLADGNCVKIAKFGTFTVRKKGQRPGRNPRTGEFALIKPRSVVVFKPSTFLRDRVDALPTN